jgi:hypothetical protein
LSGPGIVVVALVRTSLLVRLLFVYPVAAATKEKTFERVLGTLQDVS